MTKKSLEGVTRTGKVIQSGEGLFSVYLRNHGIYLFNSINAKVFSQPKNSMKVKCVHYGYRRNISVPYKVVGEDGTIFYDE